NTGDEITKISIGYHTVVPLANGVQVFVPTWKITVNDEQYYFVNAIEGIVFPGDETEFFKQVIDSSLSKIHKMEKNITLKESLIRQLNQKMEYINRSGETK